MSLVMVVDDTAVVREPIAASLRASGYQTLCAGDGTEALAAIQSKLPDLVLLDLSMPGMDGMAVLRALRAQSGTAKIPVILLTASSDKANIVEAARLGVRDYVLKTRFSLSELLARVRKYAAQPAAASPQAAVPAQIEAVPPALRSQDAASPPRPNGLSSPEIPRLLNRDECERRAREALGARTLSGVVGQVIAVAASPHGDMAELAALISRDPLLSARLLHAANTASYSSTRGVVCNIADAVRNIGCAGIRDIASSLAVFDAMPASEPDGFNPIRSWQHSFAVATLCNRLAAERDRGVAYLIGLCHDLGEILFRSHFGPEYRRVLEVQQATGKRREELERLMLGMSHGELVQTILRCLKLPEEVRRPIASFHEAGTSRAAVEPLARLLQVADFYSTGTLLASSEHALVRPLTRVECRNAIGVDDPPPPDGTPLRGEIYALTATLARLSAKDEAKLLEPLYPRKSVRVMVVRDPSLSPFDPVAAGLQALADVTVREALPGATELAGHAGLVVLSRSTSAAGFTASQIKSSVPAPLPVLWLTGRIDGNSAPNPEPLAPVLWPVPLSRLAEFVLGI